MFNILSTFNMTPVDCLLYALCGLMIGMTKTGVGSLGLIVVPTMASIFGSRPSVGLVLPMLMTADIFAVRYYHRHAELKHVFRLLPWTIIGISIGLLFGNTINDEQFKITIGVLVLLGIILIVIQDLKKNSISIPEHWWFAALLGLTGGFSTMIGNAAGPIMSLYLLTMKLPKNNFIGTAAWFFLIVNLLKFPLHIFFWQTINSSSLLLNALVIPMIILGVLVGILIVKHIPDKAYRIFIIISTVLAAFMLI